MSGCWPNVLIVDVFMMAGTVFVFARELTVY